MVRNCDVCGEEYKPHSVSLKRGWGLSCSKKCAATLKGQRKAEKHWQQIVNKYSTNITLPKEMPKTVNEKFTIYCSLHGESKTTIANLSDNKYGCPKCGMRTIVYRNDTKQCRVCNEWMPLDQYCKTGKFLKSGEPTLEHRCKKCKAYAHKKYQQTDNYKPVRDKTVKKHREKKKQELLDLGKGPFCNVTVCKCEQCAKLFTKRGIAIKRFCSNECLTNRRLEISRKSKIWKLKDYNCKICNKEYKGKAIGSCPECKKKKHRIANKAQKKKRHLSLRTVAIQSVVDIKVFERDKWRCKICGVKLQKEFIYRHDAAEVDHIVPISLGGPHSYSNTQAACRKCNQEKSNKYYGQLILSI